MVYSTRIEKPTTVGKSFLQPLETVGVDACSVCCLVPAGGLLPRTAANGHAIFSDALIIC